MTISLFGIPNCNSVKKARVWLTNQGVDYDFIDFKKTPPTEQQLLLWIEKLGLDVLINKKGTTWRALDEQDKILASDSKTAPAILIAKPSLIKRPLIIWPDKTITVGYNEAILTQYITS